MTRKKNEESTVLTNSKYGKIMEFYEATQKSPPAHCTRMFKSKWKKSVSAELVKHKQHCIAGKKKKKLTWKLLCAPTKELLYFFGVVRRPSDAMQRLCIVFSSFTCLLHLFYLCNRFFTFLFPTLYGANDGEKKTQRIELINTTHTNKMEFHVRCRRRRKKTLLWLINCTHSKWAG